MFTCSKCSKQFHTLTSLYNHKTRNHPPVVLVSKQYDHHNTKFSSDTDGSSDSEISVNLKPSLNISSSGSDSSSDSEISVNLKPSPKISDESFVYSSDSEISVNLKIPQSNHTSATNVSPVSLNKGQKRDRTMHSRLLLDQSSDLDPSSNKKRRGNVVNDANETEDFFLAKKWQNLYSDMKEKYEKLRKECEICMKNKSNGSNIKLSKELTKHKDSLRMMQEKIVKDQAINISLKDEKQELRRKLKESEEIIEQLQDGPSLDAFNSISKSIFNCISIEEIERVRKLFLKNKISQIQEVKNIRVLQKIIQGLRRGYIPICNPQQSRLSDAHQLLLDNMNKATKTQMIKIIQNNTELLSDLMHTVDSSLKFIVNLYNKFGSLHDDSQSESSDTSDEDDTSNEDDTSDDDDTSDEDDTSDRDDSD